MKCCFPAPVGTWPHSKGAFFRGLGRCGPKSFERTTTGRVNTTPTRPMTKTVPMSPKRAMKKVTLSVYLRYVQEVERTPLFERSDRPQHRVETAQGMDKEGLLNQFQVYAWTSRLKE